MNHAKCGFSSSSLPIKGLVLLLLLLALLLPSTAGPVQAGNEIVSPFQDLDASDDNFRYVKFLQNRGVINGFPDGTFRSFNPLTRAEAAKMLVTAAGATLLTPEQATYSDVPQDHWAYPYIETATQLGLLKGYPDGTFQPGHQLTRAETAVILFRLYGVDYQWSGESLAVDLPQWAYGQVNSIIDAGLMGVDAENRFQPDWPATRIEFTRAFALLHTIHDDWRIVSLKATLHPKAGVVQLQKPGRKAITISEPTVLAVDDVVITGAKGEAEIRFEDGSGFLLQPNSEMKVQKLLGSLFILPDGTEASAVEDLEVQFLKGSMFGALATRGVDPEALLQTAVNDSWLMFPLLALAGDNWEAIGYSPDATLAANGQISPIDMEIDIDSEEFKKLPPWKQMQLKKVRVKVNMPHGVAAVRGSFWKIQLEQIGNRVREIVNFIHGEGEVQSGDYTVPIKAGEKTAIEEPGAPPTPPEPMTKEEQQEWVAMKTWIAERIQEIEERLVAPPTAPAPTPVGQQPPVQGQQPTTPTVPQPLPPTPQVSRLLESLQELLSTMEALEEEFGLPPAPEQPEATDDDDDDYDEEPDPGDGEPEPGDDEPEPGDEDPEEPGEEEPEPGDEDPEEPGEEEPEPGDEDPEEPGEEEPEPGDEDPEEPGDEEPVVPVNAISVEPEKLEISVGDTKNIHATVVPAYASDKRVIWSSNDDNVATVNEIGEVTGVGLGTATITVTSVYNSSIKTEIQVTVGPDLKIEGSVVKGAVNPSITLSTTVDAFTSDAIDTDNWQITLFVPESGTGPFPLDQVNITGYSITLTGNQSVTITFEGAFDRVGTLLISANGNVFTQGLGTGVAFFEVGEPGEEPEEPQPASIALLSSNPADNSANVSVTGSIELTFNKEINEVDPGKILLWAGAELIAIDEVDLLKENTKLIIKPEPSQPYLPYGTVCSLILREGAITDSDDKELAETIITFATEPFAGTEQAKVTAGRIDFRPLVEGQDPGYLTEISIQFAAGVKIQTEDMEDNFSSLPFTINNTPYFLEIWAGNEQPLTFDKCYSFHLDSDDERLSVILESEDRLQANNNYFIRVWKDEPGESEDVLVDEYNLTSLGFAAVNMDLGELENDDYSLANMPFLSAVLKSADSSQFTTIYLARDEQSTSMEYSATIPLYPGMASGEWYLTSIRDYPEEYIYYYPELRSDSLTVRNVEAKEDFNPVEIVIDISETALVKDEWHFHLRSEIRAEDPSGIDFLMAIFQSPIGELIPVEYFLEDASEGLWIAETWVDMDGKWTLAGLISKDGANNWVIPEIAMNAGIFPELGYYYNVSHDVYPEGINPHFYDNILVDENGDGKVFAYGDFTPPQLISASFSTPLLALDGTLAVNAHIMDELSKIRTVKAELVWWDYLNQEFVVIGQKEISELNSNNVELAIELSVDEDWYDDLLSSFDGYGICEIIIEAEDEEGNLLRTEDINRTGLDLTYEYYSVLAPIAPEELIMGPYLAIEAADPWSGAQEVSIAKTVSLRFNWGIQFNEWNEKKVELQAWDGGQRSVIESVYIDNDTLQIELDGFLEYDQWYTLTIPRDLIEPQEPEDPELYINGLLGNIVLHFRTEPEYLDIELGRPFEDLGYWLEPDVEGYKNHYASIYINDNIRDDYWLWIQYDEHMPKLIRSDADVLLLPGTIKLWPVDIDPKVEPDKVSEHDFGTLYLPDTIPLLEGDEELNIAVKGANLPNGESCSFIVLDWSDTYEGDEFQSLEIKDNVLTIPLPARIINDEELNNDFEVEVFYNADSIYLSHFIRIFKKPGEPEITVDWPYGGKLDEIYP